MKKVVYLFLFAILLVVGFGNQPQMVSANTETDSITDGTTAYTDYAPVKSDHSDESQISPLGLDFARGTIACYVIAKDAYCPWTIQVGGDLISYSNVTVEIQKDYGFFNGGWQHYKTHTFRYPINTPSSTIRNESSDRLSEGKYRARLGGTFTTIKNGVYSAVANGWSYFEVK